MIRPSALPLALVLALLTAPPVVAQTTYTWNPSAAGANTWDTTSAVWSTTGTAPYDQTFANGASNNAVLALNSGTATLNTATALSFGQLAVASDGFTISNSAGGASNPFAIGGGIRTVGGPRTLTLNNSGGGTQNFAVSGTGDTSAGKLTLVVGGVSQFGLAINSADALGSNTDLVATATAGGVGVTGTRILLGSSVNAGVSLSLDSNSTGDLRSTLMAGTGNSIAWNGAVNLTGNGSVHIDSGPSNNLAINGAVSSAAAGRMILRGTGMGTVNGVIGGPTGVTKADVGTWRLTANNTFTGTAEIQSGTLEVLKLDDGGVASPLGAATGADAAIRLGNPGSNSNATLSYNWATVSSSTNRDIQLVSGAGGSTQTIQASTLNGVFLTLTGNVSSPSTAAKTLALTGGNFLSGGTASGVISGSGASAVSLTKSGSSIWTLTGNNTYSGTTTVSSGRLVINGDQSAATGAVSVSGTLGGTGTVGGATTVNLGGLIRGDIGTGVGTLNVANGVTITGGGNTAAGGGIAAAVSDTGVNQATAGKVNLTGAGDVLNFNLGASNKFRVQLEQGATPLTTDGTETYTVTLARVSTAGNIQLNGSPLLADAVIPTTRYDLSAIGFTIRPDAVLQIDGTGRDLILTFTPVPEPAAVGLVAAAGLGLVRVVRRRRPARTMA